MKNLLLFFCLFLVVPLFSQKQAEVKHSKVFKIQGGYFFDGTTAVNYSGFNLLNLGLMKVDEKKLKGIDLELIAFDFGAGFVSVNKKSAELSAYQSYALLGDFKNGLFVGPSVSLGVVRERTTPFASNTFSESQSILKLGGGLKVDYSLSLSSKIYLTVSSRVTLLDFGFLSGRVENPLLPIQQQQYGGFEFNFLRQQFPLMIGLSIPLGK